MKQLFLGCVLLGAFIGISYAEDRVTIYGAIDEGVRRQTNTDSAGNSKTSISSIGTYNGNRLGFRGREDLGDGQYATFNLEMGFNGGTGTLDSATTTGYFFNRESTVGLGGDWGNFKVGRMYSVDALNNFTFDPFRFKYPGLIGLSGASAGNNPTSAVGGTRLDNDIQYGKVFGPVALRAEWSLGEVAGDTRTNAVQALGLIYNSGPLSFGGAYTKKKVASSRGTATVPQAAIATSPAFDDSVWSFGAAYKFDDVRLSAGFNNETLQGAIPHGAAGALIRPSFGGADSSVKISWLGAEFGISPAFSLTGAWFHREVVTAAAASTPTEGKRDMFILSGTYSLSKRTALYAEIDTTKFGGNQVIGFGTPLTQERQTGISAGISHTF
jgi:predicted porin